MTRLALVICMTLVLSGGDAAANVPFPAFSTCHVTITQFPTRTACLSSSPATLDVVRLTPAGSSAVPPFDLLSVRLRARDANGVVVVNAFVSFSEQQGIANIADGGMETAFTDAEGEATVKLHGASGWGRVVLCADGVQMCNFLVRSPDVVKGSLPTQCGIGTGVSAVSGADILNPACGFIAAFGTAPPGTNNGYDLNCDTFVNGFDVIGSLGKGGAIQYFGDTATLGLLSPCP